jgi:hypothetical protein
MEEQKPKYDPLKQYQWEQNATFQISGPEFGAILNGLRAILNTPETKRIVMALEAARNLDTVLARAVETGEAKEIEIKEKPKMQKA